MNRGCRCVSASASGSPCQCAVSVEPVMCQGPVLYWCPPHTQSVRAQAYSPATPAAVPVFTLLPPGVTHNKCSLTHVHRCTHHRGDRGNSVPLLPASHRTCSTGLLVGLPHVCQTQGLHNRHTHTHMHTHSFSSCIFTSLSYFNLCTSASYTCTHTDWQPLRTPTALASLLHVLVPT